MLPAQNKQSKYKNSSLWILRAGGKGAQPDVITKDNCPCGSLALWLGYWQGFTVKKLKNEYASRTLYSSNNKKK